jgi:hypothetical protein
MTGTTYAADTCGFLPLHLYEDRDLDHALDVVSAICAFGMEEFVPNRASASALQEMSLQQMLDAVRLVERYNRRPVTLNRRQSFCAVPADRLTAAVYALLGYRPRVADKDEDTIPVRFSQRRWGQLETFFLVVGGRPAAEFEAANDTEAA